MTRLDLSHFESLVAVVEAGSVTAAAKQLMISQSAVSHRLAEAERRLGYPLFDRRPARPLRPTPAALALCQTAQRVLPELRRAESDFLRAEGQERDVVRLGVGSYDCYHWLAGFHSYAREQLPEVLFELVVVGDSPAAQLADGAVDVVLAIGNPEGRYASMPLFDDELVLITHPAHEAAKQAFIEPSMVKDEVYITYSRTPSPGFEYDRFIRPAGLTPRTTLVIEQTNVIAEMVATGVGVSILSRWAMSPWLENNKIAAIACGPTGLPLNWRALVRPTTPDESLERRVSALIAHWLSGDLNPA